MTENTVNNISTNVKRVRDAYLASGLTYSKLALLVGVKRNTLACWITGKRNPSNLFANLIEEKVYCYLNGKEEYINKNVCRSKFKQEITRLCDEFNNEQIDVHEEFVNKIMNCYDNLPTVNFKKK